MTPEELARRLDSDAFRALVRELMQRVVLTVEGNVKRVTPVRTGTLRRSITSRVEATGERGVVGTKLSYARAVHEGTRPHTITPTNKRALAWKGGAHPVRSVQHPGTKGVPFFRIGADESRADIERLAQEAGVRFFAEVAG